MSVDLGRDTSCTDGLRVGVIVTGARLVAEAIYRRLTTRRGQLRGGKDEANYGINLPDYVGGRDSRVVEASLPAVVKAEVVKDQRIDESSVVVTVTRSTLGLGVAYDVHVHADTGDGPFDLVLAVSDVTAEIVGLTTGGT